MRDAAVLDALPGEVAFLGAGSARPPHFPSVYDPATGQFAGDPREAIAQWYADQPANQPAGASPRFEPPIDVVATNDDAPQFLAPVVLDPVGDANRGLAPAGSIEGANRGLAPAGSFCTHMGDYNADGFVDAADYSVWRDTLTSTVDLRADGDGNLVVEEADYGVWLAHYGEECPALPGAFDILGPVGVQAQKPNTISWTESAGATSYRFVLSQQPDASFPLYDEVVTATSRSLPLNDGVYYVAVYAQNAAGETLASNAVFAITVDLPVADQLMFVSASRYFVSTTPLLPPSANTFGSVLAADYHCTNIANSAGLLSEPWDGETLHFRALLTQGTIDVQSRASMRQGVYYNTAGDIVANTVGDVMLGTRLAPILTQSAVQLTGTQVVWTGTNTDGTTGNNCINWSQTTGSAQAGNLNGAGTNWLFQGNINSNSQQRLYCVGDRQVTPPATIAAPAVDQPAGASPRFDPQHQPEGASPRLEPAIDVAATNDVAPQFPAPIEIDPVGGANRGLAPAGSLARAGVGLLAERGGVGPASREAVYVAPRREDLLLVASERAAAVDAVMELGVDEFEPGASARRLMGALGRAVNQPARASVRLAVR